MTRAPGLNPSRRRGLAGVVVAAALLVGGLTACDPAPNPPSLRVTPVVSGLSIPWDLTFTPDGTMIFTERAGAIKVRRPNGSVNQLFADMSGLYVNSEGGLTGIVVDPQFAQNRLFYTCQAHSSGGQFDVRVVRWVVNTEYTVAYRQPPLLVGMPLTSGRHSGCRLRVHPDGSLWVGTGDAVIGTAPMALNSLGGKVLRVSRADGAGLPDNPLAGSTDANARRLWSWGHRNLQGLALRPSDGQMWTAEHGPDRDDEINLGAPGNFGWDPVPGYNEAVPMTDKNRHPSAIGAVWSSGPSTIATSGATFLSGPQWKGWDGALAVATLKDQTLRIYRLRSNNTLIDVSTPPELNRTRGRLRTAQLGPDGNLYVTTSNGSNDQILRVTPNP